MPGLVEADQRRRQHRAHRPGIDPAIGMAADRGIDRAMVEAGGAADAAQHVLELAAEQVGCGRCRAARRGIARARRDRPAGAARSRTSCRTRIPARSPSAPAGAAGSPRPPASARPFRCWSMTIWTRGRVCVRSPLPSLVTMMLEPVSATRKLAPVMPTSAARNCGRSIARASSHSCARLVERARRDRDRDARRGRCRRPAPSSGGSPAR